MIHHIRGTLDEKNLESVVLEAGGVGYRVFVPLSTVQKLPSAGSEVKLFVVESVAMYGGATTLYGFLSAEERDLFTLLRDEVPGAGAKKALDYLDKVSKSLPDFRRCVVERDVPSLCGIFGFTKKTAEKLAGSLKDKIGSLSLPGTEKWKPAADVPGNAAAEAVAGLVALGYRESQAREAVEKATGDGASAGVPEIIRKALRYL